MGTAAVSSTTNVGVTVRPCAADDFERWFSLFDTVAGEGRWLGSEAPLDRAARRAFFEGCVTGEGSALLLAESPGGPGVSPESPGGPGVSPESPGGVLVGSISLTLTSGVVDLGMFVADGHRGAGVGSALLAAGVEWARERGAHKVTLGLWTHNHRARALYAKFGFVSEGTRRRQWRRRNGELWDATLMALILDVGSPGGPASALHPARPPLALPAGGLRPGELVLRPWTASDAPALIEAIDEGEIRRWLDMIPDPYVETDAEEFISTTTAAATDGQSLGLAVTAGGRLVGSLGLRLEPGAPTNANIGYWTAAPARGRGVASIASRALCDWAFAHAGVRRIELLAATGNIASRAVAERAGFEFEGVRRSWRVIRGEPVDFAAYARLAP